MLKNIVNFIFELNTLKKFEHSGFKLAGINKPDSIAEHAFRAAVIAYVLAVEEKHPDPEKISFMTLIHDNGEARITDLHKVAAKYLDTKDAEMKAFKEQTIGLPKEMSAPILKYFKQYEDRTTKGGIIAKDADLLEIAFQAKEYLDTGYTECIDWINNVEKHLQTKSAKRILKEVRKTKFTDWWQGLKNINKK
jgi:putative hydrolases of HD superfamily